MSSGSRVAPVALASLVGALAAFAISPVPMYFDAEWLAWALIPVFAVVGAILSLIFLSSADKGKQ